MFSFRQSRLIVVAKVIEDSLLAVPKISPLSILQCSLKSWISVQVVDPAVAMKFNPYLGFALLGASFCLVAGKPHSVTRCEPMPCPPEKVPTAEELKCKEKEIVTKGWGGLEGYYCELHPKHQKPLFYCENDSDCVKACKEHKYPEKCKEMTTCDKSENDIKICNDLVKCQILDDTTDELQEDTCDRIGNKDGFADLKCEKRKGHDGPRCFFDDLGTIHKVRTPKSGTFWPPLPPCTRNDVTVTT